MIKNLNVFLIIGLSILVPPSHTKEIFEGKGSISSSIEGVTEEMISLNSSLDLLSITISNLLPRGGRRLDSSF